MSCTQSGKGGAAFLSHKINILGDDLIMETNNKTIDENEKERFIKVVNEYPIKIQEDFRKCYKKEYRQSIAQSYVSDKFREYNIVKVDGVYTYVPTPPEEVLLMHTLKYGCNYVSNIHSDFYQVVLKCKAGYETTLCKLLSEQFEGRFHALIPAYCSVIVVCRLKKNAEIIREFIQSHYTKKTENSKKYDEK